MSTKEKIKEKDVLYCYDLIKMGYNRVNVDLFTFMFESEEGRRLAVFKSDFEKFYKQKY